MNAREQKREARAVWRSLEGCDCPNHINGKAVKRDERCTADAIRCNARLAVVHAKLEAMGLDLQGKPLSPPPPVGKKGAVKE